MLDQRLAEMRERTRSGYYHRHRTEKMDFAPILQACQGMSACQGHAYILEQVLAVEKPVIEKGERLQFTRTMPQAVPSPQSGKILENLSLDYALLLHDGIAGRLKIIEKNLQSAENTEEENDFLTAARRELLAVAAFAKRYEDAARAAGENECAEVFARVPMYPAETLQQALQCVYFLSATLRLSGSCHLGFGRADQYLLDCYRQDLASGRETAESARKLLTEFFLCLNRDGDIFVGVQSGDNGQSMMLGGCKRDGSPAENELTTLLMEIAADVSMIEPKINLRISSRTSDEILKSAARLSGCGLGFPQYCNDEVVIPGLVRFGYEEELARDYTVAACWEFVIPDGRDVPNIYAANLALAADRAIRYGLQNGGPFEDILADLSREIRTIVQTEQKDHTPRCFIPNPLFSAFTKYCLEEKHDLNVSGGRHRHFGCHGCGSSTAADSLATVKKLVYDEKKIAPATLLAALEADYVGYDGLRETLKREGEHVGASSKSADAMLKRVFDDFADAVGEIRDNGFGGRVRPGTGSAMNYVWMVQADWPNGRIHASADGRKDGDFISSSLAPAPGVKADGMLSVLQSYRQLDYQRLCNGGPITMELDPVYFKSPAAIAKLSDFLRAFQRSGCQQLQLNTLDADVLRDAQKHPENHRDLIVRVWGWSGYFVELAKPFQDQIIGRQAFRG